LTAVLVGLELATSDVETRDVEIMYELRQLPLCPPTIILTMQYTF